MLAYRILICLFLANICRATLLNDYNETVINELKSATNLLNVARKESDEVTLYTESGLQSSLKLDNELNQKLFDSLDEMIADLTETNPECAENLKTAVDTMKAYMNDVESQCYTSQIDPLHKMQLAVYLLQESIESAIETCKSEEDPNACLLNAVGELNNTLSAVFMQLPFLPGRIAHEVLDCMSRLKTQLLGDNMYAQNDAMECVGQLPK